MLVVLHVQDGLQCVWLWISYGWLCLKGCDRAADAHFAPMCLPLARLAQAIRKPREDHGALL
jgi:hypothetical protein